MTIFVPEPGAFIKYTLLTVFPFLSSIVSTTEYRQAKRMGHCYKPLAVADEVEVLYREIELKVKLPESREISGYLPGWSRPDVCPSIKCPYKTAEQSAGQNWHSDLEMMFGLI